LQTRPDCVRLCRSASTGLHVVQRLAFARSS
jgi:hypothetical protein